MITKELLEELYISKRLSMSQIADELNCSVNKIVYWMDRNGIKRRSISDAIYQKANPSGDPFSIAPINTIEQAVLHGTGVGLYWGEGTKASKHSVRLGNSDPELIKTFMRFLIELYGVDKERLKFGLQTFTDIDSESAVQYWMKELNVKRAQFYKVHITISGSIGIYKKKSEHGVLTLYFHNKKLRDIIFGLLPR